MVINIRLFRLLRPVSVQLSKVDCKFEQNHFVVTDREAGLEFRQDVAYWSAIVRWLAENVLFVPDVIVRHVRPFIYAVFICDGVVQFITVETVANFH